MANKIQIRYDELEDLNRKVNQWADRVDELLTKARLCQMMMDDGVWIGRGADKYRAELEGRAIPGLRKLLGALRDTHYGILRAGDTFRDAEQNAARQIERLSDISIPSGFGLGARDNSGLGFGGSGGGGGNGPQNLDPNKPKPIGNTFPDGFGGNSGVVPPNLGGNFGIPDFPSFPIPDPRIPDIFPIENGETIPRPDWYTEYSEDVDGFNGAAEGALLLIDGGGTSQTQHMGNIVGESVAAGGVPVSGMLVSQNLTDSRQAERVASAVGGFLANNPNAQVKLSPGLQALINGIATDSLGRSLMDMPTQAEVDSMRQFVEILKTTVEAFGRVLPGL